MSAPSKPNDRLSQAALALAHPIRREIIHCIRGGIDTPAGMAEAMIKPLGVVSYHCRMLRDYEIVEVKRTEPRRGALQHFYGFTEGASFDLFSLGNAVTAANVAVSYTTDPNRKAVAA